MLASAEAASNRLLYRERGFDPLTDPPDIRQGDAVSEGRTPHGFRGEGNICISGREAEQVFANYGVKPVGFAFVNHRRVSTRSIRCSHCQCEVRFDLWGCVSVEEQRRIIDRSRTGAFRVAAGTVRSKSSLAGSTRLPRSAATRKIRSRRAARPLNAASKTRQTTTRFGPTTIPLRSIWSDLDGLLVRSRTNFPRSGQTHFL